VNKKISSEEFSTLIEANSSGKSITRYCRTRIYCTFDKI